MNAASMNNSGFEFSATYRNRDRDFKYELSANLSTLRNRVTSLGFVPTLTSPEHILPM